jgi:hypothetical protein
VGVAPGVQTAWSSIKMSDFVYRFFAPGRLAACAYGLGLAMSPALAMWVGNAWGGALAPLRANWAARTSLQSRERAQ